MRTNTAIERAAVGALHSGHYSKFEVQDADGVYRDYTTYLRTDWFTGASIFESQDQSTMTLNATLLRETGTLSLSPFRSDSLVNRNAGGSYANAIDAWRKWRLSVAVMREGYPPTGADWKELCQGRIDIIEWSGDQIIITGRGEEAVLLDFWIAAERQYGSVAGIAMETTIQSQIDDNLSAGIYPLYTPVSPSYLMNAWTQPKGNLFPSTVAVSDKAGFVLRFRYDAANAYRLTLFQPNRAAAPGSEVWTIGASEITGYQKVAVDKQGIRNFIKLRFAHATLGTQTVISPWQAGVGTVSCAAGVATFSSSQAGVIKTTGSKTEIIVAGIAYTVNTFNGTTGATLISQLATGGVPTFGATAFTLSDTVSGSGNGSTASIDRFGRTDLELDLSFTTQVTDPTKAQAMADFIRSDSEFPPVEHQFETLGFWFVQLHDYGRFLANGVHYDQDQYGGVTSIRHDIANGTIKSTIGVRGKPSGKYAGWRYSAGAMAGGSIGAATVPLLLRVKGQTTTATQIIFRVAAADATPLSDILVTYSGVGTGIVSPASPQTIAKANVTSDIETTGTVDITVPRAAFGAGMGRITFTATSPNRIPSTDSGDVPEVNRDTQSLTPVAANLFNFNAGGPSSSNMWCAWTWGAFTIYKPDGTTISVGASSGLAAAPTPSLSQVAGGALGARTRFVRIAYMKNGLACRISAESSLAINANNLLKVTSPAAVPGFDGYVVLVGSVTNTEFYQSTSATAFGNDWNEPSPGATLSGIPYNATQLLSVVAIGLDPAPAVYFYYPYWDVANGLLAMTDNSLTVKSAASVQQQNLDGRIPLSLTAISATMPAAATTGSGTQGVGKLL